MNILLASTVMVVAGVSVLIAFTLRMWSRAYQARFDDMRKSMINYERRIVAMEKMMSDTQAAFESLSRQVVTQGNQETS
jgi:ATP/maltotriose-dependent transcriptional regulator MalT